MSGGRGRGGRRSTAVAPNLDRRMDSTPRSLVERQEQRAEAAGRDHVGADTPERCLAIAVFKRALADLNGSHISSGRRQERMAGYEALEWVHDAGPDFRFWADVAGRDWRYVRASLLRRTRESAYNLRRRARPV